MSRMHRKYGKQEPLTEHEMGKILPRPLKTIASEIRRDWTNLYFGAVPYLQVMFFLKSIDEMYGDDSAREVVTRFLVNARTWRGPVARRVKAELKELIK